MYRLFFTMSVLTLTFMAFAAVGSVSVAMAEEEAGFWKSDLELGFVQTGGNTQVRTLNTKAKLVGDGETLRTTLEGSALSTTDRNATTAEKYSASIQEDWKFSEYDYLFGRVGFETDRFGGFTRRISETVGYGRELVKSDELHWKAEIGAGARQTELIPAENRNEVIGRSSTTIKWKISDGATLTQDLNTEGGREGFVSHSVTALRHKLNSSLSSKISFSVQHTSKVPVGTKNTNTETAITLVWSH
ncbi:MAG: DUF481 domain-containing protein [Mariprofundaceae bacterium]